VLNGDRSLAGEQMRERQRGLGERAFNIAFQMENAQNPGFIGRLD
jgi:hypothetical protein